MSTTRKKVSDLRAGEWVRRGSRWLEVVATRPIEHLTSMLRFAVYAVKFKSSSFTGTVQVLAEELVEVSTLVMSKYERGVQ